MNDFIHIAERLEQIPAYIFSEINAFKERALAQGMDLISLAIGDPDQPTPAPILEQMHVAIGKRENHQYSPYEGTQLFRTAVARFLQRRFSVDADPQREIVALVGSKEGIAHLPLAFCNPGDAVLYPTPGFPMYATTVTMAGGRAIPIPLTYKHQFLPDQSQLAELMKRHEPKYLILNYPHNPTAAVCPRETLTSIVDLCHRFNCFLCYDNAYSEVYCSEKARPISPLEIPGAKDITIEFQTLSKTFNMTGWRLGFAAGSEKLVQPLRSTKTHIDSGPFPATQEAGAWALDEYEQLTKPLRRMYAERRRVALNGLDRLHIEYLPPAATFYIWCRVPGGQPSMEFCRQLIEQQGLVITPGIGFGPEGEGFFRLAMTVDVARIEEAMRRLAVFLGR